MIYGTIKESSEIKSIEKIKEYSKNIAFDSSNTYHEYIYNNKHPIFKPYRNLKHGICDKFYDVYKRHKIRCIDEMNELYISSIGAKGSDQVFETNHVDGPFYLLPFCNVFRTVLAIQGNEGIYTHFPQEDSSFILRSNDYCAFDYNRDLHSIGKITNIKDDRQRIILKLHYIVVPEFVPNCVLSFYKCIHVKYNATMRYLFLHSQIKKKENNFLAMIINTGTHTYGLLIQTAHWSWNGIMNFYYFILLIIFCCAILSQMHTYHRDKYFPS